MEKNFPLCTIVGKKVFQDEIDKGSEGRLSQDDHIRVGIRTEDVSPTNLRIKCEYD